MANDTWTVTIRCFPDTYYRDFAIVKEQMLAQLGKSPDELADAVFQPRSAELRFNIHAPSSAEAHRDAAALFARVRALLKVDGLQLSDFSVKAFVPASAGSTFRVAFLNGASVDILATRFDRGGSRHELWQFYDTEDAVIATFESRIVGAILRVDSIVGGAPAPAIDEGDERSESLDDDDGE